jgi:hypothetical protein
MGYGITIMIVILCVNLIVFTGSLATHNSDINSPIIETLIDVYNDGNVLSLIPNISEFVGNTGVVLGLLITGMVALSIATGTNYITSGGGYGASMLPMLVGVFIFTTLATTPTFSAMGFPENLSTILYAIFGMIQAVGVYGVIRGN